MTNSGAKNLFGKIENFLYFYAELFGNNGNGYISQGQNNQEISGIR